MEQSSIDTHVGSRLKALRNELKLEIEHLAQMIDIGADMLHRYEAGTERIPATELQKVANVLQVSATYFFLGLRGVPKIFWPELQER